MHPYSRSQRQNPKPDKYDYITDFTEDYFEYEQGKQPISVKGRLEKNFLFWKNVLKANNSILETIHSGYKIPFVTRPPEIMLKNNKSATDNGSFVEEAISNLLKSNCIIECETKPRVVNPLTVASNTPHKKEISFGSQAHKYSCVERAY